MFKKILKNKKIRKLLILAVILVSVLFGLMPVFTGAAAISAAKGVIASAFSFSSPNANIKDDNSVEFIRNCTEDDLLRRFDEGYTLSEIDSIALRMKEDTLVYMLKRVSDYNHAGEEKRTITVQGRRRYIELEEMPDGDSIEKHVEDFDYEKEFEIDNSYYEPIIKLDYRELFYFLVLAAVDRDSSRNVLESITPLDMDYRPIIYEEGEDFGDYFITRKDVDAMITLITPTYHYLFDVMRIDKDYYNFFEAESLPHETYKEGDPETEEGEITYYIPRSFAEPVSSAFTRTANIINGNIMEETEERFIYSQFEEFSRSIFSEYTYEYSIELMDVLPGGAELLKELHSWGELDNGEMVYRKTSPAIIISGTGIDLESFSGFGSLKLEFDPGDYQDIGEAAVAWAVERSCKGEHAKGTVTNSFAWRYSTGQRYTDGYADCSSLCYRAYEAAGLNWPYKSFNTNSFYGLIMEHPEMVIFDKAGYDPSKLLPGDLILISKGAERVMASENNHIMMYMGNGKIVHASSAAGHVHIQNLASYYSAVISKRGLVYAFRPYAGLSYTIESASAPKDEEAVAGSVSEGSKN